MKDESKTKKQLINELVKLRERMAELETVEEEGRLPEETLRKNIEFTKNLIASMKEELRKHRDSFEEIVNERTKELRAINEQLQMEIAERMQANEALHENEASFRTIFDNSPDAIFIEDAEGYVLDVNPAACRLQRIDREHLIGKHVLELVPPDKRNEVARDFPKVASGEWDEAQGLSLTANGQSVPVEIRSRLIAYSGKTAVLLIVRDITARKQAEEAIQYRAEFEHLIAGLSSEFVCFNPGEVDAGIEKTLQVVGEFAEVDRSYVFLFRDDKKIVDNTHEWCAGGIEPQITNLQNLPSESVPWWMDKLNRYENIYIPNVDDLPPEAGFEKEMLKTQNIQSLVVVPMVSEDNLVGFLGFDSTKSKKEWPENIVALLRIVGDIFTNSLERKRVDKALWESEARYRLLAENATDSIWIRDMNLRHTYVSPSVTRLRGFSVEEAMGQSVEETLTPASLELVRKAWAEEMAFEEMEDKDPGRTRTLELEQYCKDGSTVWTEVEMIFLRDEGGRPSGILGCTRDITERKNLEAEREKYAERLEHEVYKKTLEFRKSEAKYRDLVEKMNEGVITLDAGMKVSFVNPAFLRMLGYREEELLGKHFTEVSWADDEAMSVLMKESEKRRRLEPSRYEVKVRHKTGKIVHALASATPIKGPDGEFAGSYAVVTDISEQKKLEWALKELSTRLVDLQEQERRRIACELHDEIGGALTGMAIELELLSHEPDMKGKAQINHLALLRDRIHETIDLVQRVSYELRPAILDDLGLPSALRWYVDTFRERTRIKAKIRMAASLERLPEAVEIAVFRITQEALTNVARHSKAESVSLILSRGKNKLSLSIKDDGVGFDPDKLYREPEERGFGIFGIQERLRSLGGNLDLQSKPGEGTRLVVTIPLGPD